MFYIIKESNELANFLNQRDIDSNHIKIAIKTLNKKLNISNRRESQSIAMDSVKNIKKHNINSDESLVNHKTQENILLDRTKHIIIEEKELN